MRLDDAFLEGMRQRGDELADAAVDELSRSRRRSEHANVLRAVEACAESSNGPCRALLEHAHTVPDWVRFDQMEAGSRAALRHALPSGLVLLCASLVESYCGFRGAKVLVRAGGLSRNTLRRVYETASFVLVIARSGASRPGTSAHRSVMRVRLMHAFVRKAMLKRDDFDVAAWGHPVNQEDAAFTLLMFSYVLPRGLVDLGARLTPEEWASIQHHWRWVGHVMGIHPDLLPESVEVQKAQYDRIRQRQMIPDADSRQLAGSLFATMGGRAPFFLPASGLEALSRYLVGQQMADALGFAPGGNRPTVGLTRGATYALSEIVTHLPFAARAAERAGSVVATASIRIGLRRSAGVAP